MDNSLIDATRTALERFPKRRLAHLPTPLLRAEALERSLAAESGRPAPRVLIKMDAWTGFGLGGNKVRKLERILAAERLTGVTCLITAGGPQSNHARVTAAAAAHLGLRCVVVTNGDPQLPARGNAALHTLFGARMVRVADRDDRDPAMSRAAEEVRAGGGHPLVVPIGASTPLGALGYVEAALEFAGQWTSPAAGDTAGRPHVFVSTSSGGTLAGLWAGLGLAGLGGCRLVGVSADVSETEGRSLADGLAGAAERLLELPERSARPELVVDTSAVGAGYGRSTAASLAAAKRFAGEAGVLLDPTYTAKAAAAMLDWILEGRLEPEDTAVFWHTGGWPSGLVFLPDLIDRGDA